MTIFRRIVSCPCRDGVVQHEPEDIPVAAGIPVAQGVPNVETGADGLALKTSGGGLSPPTPSSVEPNGMPMRPTADPKPIPVGDDAEDAGPAVGPLAIPAQVPDAFPIVPPPSKIAVDMLEEVPGIELPMPEDTCGSEPPMLEHVVMLPGAAPNGEVPDAIGLTPGDASSVAPIGIPVRGTAGAGPMPSGEVIPSGDPSGDGPIPPICAEAGALATKTAVSATSDQPVNLGRRVIRISSVPECESPCCVIQDCQTQQDAIP
jgi:hypothetical protein